MSIGVLPFKPRLKKGVTRTLLMLILFYALLCASGCAFQRRLIYFPTKLAPGDAEQAAAQKGFLPWRNKAGQIIGWKLTADTPPTGSVLIVHGNAGCASDRDYIARPIHHAASFDVYVLEYPGYGARDGSPGMKSFLAAGDDACESLPHNLPIYVVSESLGAGVAAHVAKTHPARVGGLMMVVPYDNLASVAQSKMPFLPAYFLLLDRFKPAEWLKQYHGPVMILLAGEDEVIPLKFGRRLFDSYLGPKRLQIIPNAHHNDVAEQPPDWWKEVFAFWQTNIATNKTGQQN